MLRKAFKMKLYSGYKEEYKNRHNNLWDDMKSELYNHGVKSYSIFFDEDTNILFGYLEIENELLWNKMAETEVCRKWWKYMSDIMETNDDNSPISFDLEEVFHL